MMPLVFPVHYTSLLGSVSKISLMRLKNDTGEREGGHTYFNGRNNFL